MLDEFLSPEKKLSKGRAQLVMDDAFFGSASMRMIIRPDTQNILPHATIATNGKEIVYNKDYIDSLTVPETKAELAHEMGHIILKHHLRRNGRDLALWNKACDQAVDHILNECGHIQLHKKWVDNLNPNFKGKSAEEIYSIMKSSQVDNGNSPQDNNKYTIPPNVDQPADSNQPPIPQMPPEVHGVVLDSPVDLKDETERQQAEEEVDIMIEEGAKLAGDLPGSLKELVRSRNEHQVNYRDLLRDFLETNLTPGDYDWMNPDRTYLQMGIYLPGLSEEEELPNIVFACDSSGSISSKEKQVFAEEISGVLEDFPCTIKAIYCDMIVQNTQDIDADNFPIELEFKGGGGTSFAPVFEYIEENGLEPKAILYFTDMMTSSFGKDPKVPVLWMNTNRSADNNVVPFGKMIKLDLDKSKQVQLNL